MRPGLMKNIIVGTAGHIDHGKTTLVRALTGIDTDRLEEEKRRGISIDLGFAHMEYGGVRFGFVDVPGHERFVKNMLAGASGIDLVCLVIGADESIQQQTREHFDICRLLGVERGLVAVTKADLVEPDMLELVKMEIVDFVAGTFLEGAPIVGVSGKTGRGLDELRMALAGAAAVIGGRSASGPFRLPIDRSFTLRGFGTVVTGTLIAGTLRVDDEVEVHPSGRRLRVRSLQVHGEPVNAATAGQRTAVNLAGVEAGELSRGMALTPPGLFHPTRLAECEFNLLSSASPLRHRAPIHFHAGTAEIEAQVRMLRGAGDLVPGSTGYIRVLLREPALLLPGDRFIARMFSPVLTIGGGVIIDNTADRRVRKSRVLERLPLLKAATLAQRLELFCSESAEGARLADLVARTGATPEDVRAAGSAAGLVLVRDPEPRLVTRAAVEAARAQLAAALAAFHKENPLLPGMPRSSAPVAAYLMDSVLAVSKEFAAEGEYVRLAAHRPQMTAEDSAGAARMEEHFRKLGLAAPAVDDVLGKSGFDPAHARTLLQMLLRRGSLVRVNADLICHRDAIEGLKNLLARRKGGRFGVTEFKEWTGVSRKYAIPLLEFLDRERVTRRDGDQRLIL